MLEIVKYILFLYSFLGILVAGGLFFNRENKATVFLAIFILTFSFGQLNFIYDSTSLVYHYPKFVSATYSLWLLYAPSLWLFIVYYHESKKIL